tara:strand:+ start:763 stop:1407 length:645 start_codon:yes stop_codon:yes gene_type:complete
MSKIDIFPTSSLVLENLMISRGTNNIFSNFSYTFSGGNLYLIHGSNGIGKTTLLRTIAGIIAPIKGKILYNSIPINRNYREYVSKINYIGHSNGLSPILSVQSNLETWNEINGNKNYINFAVKAFNIQRLLSLLIKDLSSGQQRRVALTRLVLCKKNIWLLDEPLNSIDEHTQKIFNKIVLEQINNNGIIIMASHQKFEFANKKRISFLDLDKH